MTSIDITIEGLDELVDRSLTRLLNEIDPTLSKFRNVSTQLLSTFETRVKENVSETLYSLEINLFVLLFAIVIFIILLLVMFRLLESVMKSFGFTLPTRKFIGLTMLTFVFIWLFVATTLSTFPSKKPVNLQTLKYVLFSVLCVGAIVMLFVWIRWICVHWTFIKNYFTDELFNFKPEKDQGETTTTVGKAMNNIPLNPRETHVKPAKF